jgi:outer membrane protein OmpA-like peptidoglycan-associated protein
MKKLFTLLCCTIVASFTYSQLRLGILGGPHSSTIIEKNNIPGWDIDQKPFFAPRSGFNIGAFAEIPLGYSKRVYFQPAIFYVSKGRKYLKLYDTASIEPDSLSLRDNFFNSYIDIPLNMTLKLPLGKRNNFMLSAGPYLSFFYNGIRTIESRIQINDTTIKFKKNELKFEAGNAPGKVNTFDFGVNARAGFELGNVMLTAFMSQGLTNFYNATYDATYNHRVFGASIGFWVSRPVEVKPRDRDKDGIPDKQDGCPALPGTALTNGCPDKDADGIADATDKCPDVAGSKKYGGCPIPDNDADGINDEEDKCPNKAGTAKYQGCPVPDSDGDGMNDETDACPDKAGTVEFNGCPIPDSDGDGLNDKEDKCPTEAGEKSNNGCPAIKKEILEKVNYAAQNIFFASNSNRIAVSSLAAIDEVVAILQNNRDLKLEIGGHTDNKGKPAANLLLSQKRADAVKQYLVQKGIDGSRIKATGYGHQKPLFDNNSEEGKAKNRRVELKLSQQ